MVVPPALEEDGGGWIAAPLVGWFCWGKKPLALLLLLLLLYEAAFPPPPYFPGRKKKNGRDRLRSKQAYVGIVQRRSKYRNGLQHGGRRRRNARAE